MITEHDLQEAIAECLGQRKPDANTCMKLAAFYTIQNELYKPKALPEPSYSYASAPPTETTIDYDSGTEFSDRIRSMDTYDVLAVMDELMTTLSVINPRLYDGGMRKL